MIDYRYWAGAQGHVGGLCESDKNTGQNPALSLLARDSACRVFYMINVGQVRFSSLSSIDSMLRHCGFSASSHYLIIQCC